MSANLKAFLDTIAWSELGPGMLAMSDNGYNVCVGSTPARPILFPSYAAHPMIRYKPLNSDAAGRYQFMGKYWDHYRDQLGLRDFGPASQDRWALCLIGECGAKSDIDAGRFDIAVDKCRSRWASFPGAGYGQPENDLAALRQVYLNAGGALS